MGKVLNWIRSQMNVPDPEDVKRAEASAMFYAVQMIFDEEPMKSRMRMREIIPEEFAAILAGGYKHLRALDDDWAEMDADRASRLWITAVIVLTQLFYREKAEAEIEQIRRECAGEKEKEKDHG